MIVAVCTSVSDKLFHAICGYSSSLVLGLPLPWPALFFSLPLALPEAARWSLRVPAFGFLAPGVPTEVLRAPTEVLRALLAGLPVLLLLRWQLRQRLLPRQQRYGDYLLLPHANKHPVRRRVFRRHGGQVTA